MAPLKGRPTRATTRAPCQGRRPGRVRRGDTRLLGVRAHAAAWRRPRRHRRLSGSRALAGDERAPGLPALLLARPPVRPRRQPRQSRTRPESLLRRVRWPRHRPAHVCRGAAERQRPRRRGRRTAAGVLAHVLDAVGDRRGLCAAYRADRLLSPRPVRLPAAAHSGGGWRCSSPSMRCPSAITCR